MAIPAGYDPVPAPLSGRAWVCVEPPSSESGRWARLPERKWTFRRSHLADLARKQERLLAAALECLAPGGIALYRTASLFKEENEQIVARALASRSDAVEWAFDLPRDLARRGRPWGYYVLPETPWAEGTFVAVLMRRS
jgi:16S rRNA (cytosine967-C5)-methyltransferase